MYLFILFLCTVFSILTQCFLNGMRHVEYGPYCSTLFWVGILEGRRKFLRRPFEIHALVYLCKLAQYHPYPGGHLALRLH